MRVQHFSCSFIKTIYCLCIICFTLFSISCHESSELDESTLDESELDERQVDCTSVCEQEALCYEVVEQKESSEIQSLCLMLCTQVLEMARVQKPQCMDILEQWNTCRYAVILHII